MEKIIGIEDIELMDSERLEEAGLSSDLAGYYITTNKQKIKLCIRNAQYCCEEWGYCMSEDSLSEFIGSTLSGITVADRGLQTKNILEIGQDADVMFVNLETSNGTLQFVAYNEHNGYYSHFSFVESNQINYECSI